MNLDELSGIPQSPLSSSLSDPLDPLDQARQPSLDTTRAPSISSDSEWVSPFTVLPPLPALRKNRNPLRSPDDRLHERSSSSQYYAAAWGSPYATPSPNRSPPSGTRDQSRQDLASLSPLSSRGSRFLTAESIRTRERDSRGQKASSIRPRPRASSWDRQKILSERFNWLSESEVSGSEGEERLGKTPTRQTYLESLSVQTLAAPKTITSSNHQNRDSVATITPDTFHEVTKSTITKDEAANSTSLIMEEPVTDAEVRPGSTPVDKPLPQLPAPSAPAIEATTAKEPSPEPAPRPKMSSSQSFQRPKKKVVWKGKTCIIAMPLTDRESAGLPPLLTAPEVRARTQRWVDEGYNVQGFILTNSQNDMSGASGQSRALYPDPVDMFAERKSGQLNVNIPDQNQWDTWVEYLKEEKLRALGVTPSNSEAPQSTQSAFSSNMSRVSSAFPSVAPSPPIGTLSANGNPIRIASATFSPPLSHPGLHSQAGSHVPSPLNGMTGPGHGYKQSIALPRMSSPFDYPVSQPNIFGQNMRQNSSGPGMRQFSPPVVQNLQSIHQVLAPALPIVPSIPSNDNGSAPQNSSMESIRQQQQRQQQIHAQMLQNQHQRQQSLFSPPIKVAEVPRTPNVLESPTRSTPEIMHPTPRSHRHNLSAALQKGIDEAEAAQTISTRASEAPQPEQRPASTVAEEIEEQEQEQEELPVLKRPETFDDLDEKSDIETNPSIAESPQLMDDSNPFGNLTSLKDLVKTRPQHLAHRSSGSISKFNVEAPEFSPSKAGFSFHPTTAAAFAPAHSNNPSITRLTHKSKQSSLSKFNVEAPTFMPSFLKQASPDTSSSSTPVKQLSSVTAKSAEKPAFTFGSPAFNVEAPEFKPGETFSFNAPETVAAPVLTFGAARPPSVPTVHHAASGSIFGSVFIEPNAKVNRRTTKALPIIPPKSREATPQEASFDEDGREKAPLDRQKRARHVDADGDRAPLFAASAPFNHSEGLSVKTDMTREPTPPVGISETQQTQISDASSVVVEAANTDKLRQPDEEAKLEPIQEVEIELASGESKDEASNVPTPTSRVEAESTEVSTIEKPTSAEQTAQIEAVSEEKHQPEVVAGNEKLAPDSDVRPTSPAEDTTVESSLSALAASFNPIPVPAPAPAPRKGGLAASRFAGSPPPKISAGLKESKFAAPRQPTPPVASQPSPPAIARPLSPAVPEKSPSPSPQLYEDAAPDDGQSQGAEHTVPQMVYDGTTPRLPNIPFEVSSELMDSIESSVRPGQEEPGSKSPSERSRIVDTQPSWEEIDAVMKQFDDNPDLGIEREQTPVKLTPLIDMRLPSNFRSDAPSPSPRHLQEGFRQRSPMRRADFGLGIHKLHSDSHGEISDWGNDYSPQQEDKIRARAGFFDGQVNEIVDSIIENRLEPLERSLHTIQHSIAILATKPNQQGRRSLSTDKRDSDADDEDDYNEFEGFSQSYRSRSPSKKDRRSDRIRTAVIDAMAAYQPPSEQTALDMSEIRAVLGEMRQISQHAQLPAPQPDFKTMIEEAMASHPRFKSPPIKNDDHEALQETFKLKSDVLESSLKAAEENAEREAKLRIQTEQDLQTLNQKLLDAQDIAHRHHEAHEEAQLNHSALIKEKDRARGLEVQLAQAEDRIVHLGDKNNKLEELADEYRKTREDLHEKINKEQSRNQDLIFTLQMIKAKHSDRDESRQALRDQIERLKERMSHVMQDVQAEEADWRRREHELIVANQRNQAALDHEMRHRERIELRLDTLSKEYREIAQFRAMHEHSQLENTRLQTELSQLRQQNATYQEKVIKQDHALANIKSNRQDEVSKATAALQQELAEAVASVESIRIETESQLKKMQSRLDNTGIDAEVQRAKHDNALSEVLEGHKQALHETGQKHAEHLEEQRTSYETKLNDLRERHTHTLQTLTEDRQRLEAQLNERLALSEDKARHMEGKVLDLEDRLEVTKSAARAAVEAATAKGVNIPTPAPSVVASPPQRAGSASMPMVKGTDIPEKISPQALRESIMVLQDQLQNREQKIEGLEQELASMDKEAPLKLKERDTEITMLRELLSVRVDDLEEIITTLARPSYDREAVKDAAIRLRANLQMQQQLRERATATASAGSAQGATAVSSGVNASQSPRGLPLAAAAAWGNWRKARDFSQNALNTIAGTNLEQTPSRSTSSSPGGFLAGMMTPPNTSQRTPSPVTAHPFAPPSMRPLAPAGSSRKTTAPSGPARPLRGYSSQPRALSNRQVEKRRESNASEHARSRRRSSHARPEPPMTPIMGRSSDSSMKSLDFGDDVDEDASSFSGIEAENDEPEDTPQASRKSVTAVRDEA